MMKLPKTGQKLRRIRLELGYTQKQAAEMAWITERAWQKLEASRDLSQSAARVELFMLKANIITQEEADDLVSKLTGTWARKSLWRKKLISASNKAVNELIILKKDEIRLKKSKGAYNSELRQDYAELTNLELMLIEEKY